MTDPPTDQLHLLPPPEPLRRADALARLAALVGQDLRPLAQSYGITVFRDGRRNKGWAGQTVERYLGQSPNSVQAADFGDWELKVTSLVPDAQGAWRLKETVAITGFNPIDLEETEFEDSHLLAKLRNLVVVARSYEGPAAARSIVLGAAPFDLGEGWLYAAIREDYEEIRWAVQSEGVHALSGRIGQSIHPRPRGNEALAAYGFYAHKRLIGAILGVGHE